MKNFYQIFFALLSMSIVAYGAFYMHQELYDRGYDAGVKAATSQLNTEMSIIKFESGT
jgi:hypothetical protein